MAKRVSFTELQIEENVVSYQDAVIQIRNISKISIEPMEKLKVPYLCVILAIMFFWVLYKIEQTGWAVLVFFGFMIPVFYTIIRNDDLGVYLHLSLNSGDKVYFECTDEEFLKQAFKNIVDSIKVGGKLSVNFKDCTINNAGRDINNGDTVHGDKFGGDKFRGEKVNGDKILNRIKINASLGDWENAEQIFGELLNCYEINSGQYRFCEMAQIFCRDRNKSKLKTLIERNWTIFQNIISSLASTGFIEILKRLTERMF